MRDDFAVFILTHGRPDNQITLRSLKRSGYTGKWYIVIDDEDATAAEYRQRFGDRVVQFSKAQIEKSFDICDQGGDRRTITYARNACWPIARSLGLRYFIQLDDDYTGFTYRWNHERNGRIYTTSRLKQIDKLFQAMIEFLNSSPRIRTVAIAQNGDLLRGNDSGVPFCLKRKAMNSFLCDVEKPITFIGRMNEDVCTYVTGGRRGELFLTFMGITLGQVTTQHASGGISELYRDLGTYRKAMYTVMLAPSCTKVGALGQTHVRIHHSIDWRKAVPKIVAETYRRSPRWIAASSSSRETFTSKQALFANG
jgi:hypothetical protein